MVQFIDLCGEWQFKSYVGEDWVWRHGEKPGTKDVRWWQTGIVPGSVYHDLWQNGAICNPYFEQNSLLLEWIPARTWVYRREFFLNEDLKGKHFRLHFQGVDFRAKFYLNGKFLGEHNSMFTPVSFSVSDFVQFGATNLLAVVLEPAPPSQPQVGRTSLVDLHKSRMGYWWDFCPRMIHLGIWDRVYLEITDGIWLENIFVRPVLNQRLDAAHLEIEYRIVHLPELAGITAEVELEIYRGDSVVAESRAPHLLVSRGQESKQIISPKNPDLWWPNGYGPQCLYTLRAKVGSWEHWLDFGIRKVEWHQNEGASSCAFPYKMVVNNKPVYIKGWNWVPIDVCYGVERPEKLSHLLTLAKQANVNLLRIWGGGLIEKNPFYQLCDEMGIMVWQEFCQSSSGIENTPSEDSSFISLMQEEAEQIVVRKRNHPSLVIWCGGNELQDERGIPLSNATSPVLAALSQVVSRLDPDRYWLPTSPTGPLFLNSLENIRANPTDLHDVHGPWEHQGLEDHYKLYNSGTSLLHSEFGTEGMANKRTLDATISQDKQWPATRDNPIYFHLGSWWNNEPFVQQAFGGLATVDDLIRCSQFLQYESLRYALEANRRRKFSNSGSLPWQFNEPYPNAFCTAAVDYYARPKPAYYGVQRAFAPITITAEFPRQTWEGYSVFAATISVGTSSYQVEGKVIAKLRDTRGNSYGQKEYRVTVRAGQTLTFGDFSFPLENLPEVFFLELQLCLLDGRTFSNLYPFSRKHNLRPLLEIPATKLVCTWQKDGKLKLVNLGQNVALQIWLEDLLPLNGDKYIRFSHNYFSLFPGEKSVIQLEPKPENESKIQIAAWNTQRQILTYEMFDFVG